LKEEPRWREKAKVERTAGEERTAREERMQELVDWILIHIYWLQIITIITYCSDV